MHHGLARATGAYAILHNLKMGYLGGDDTTTPRALATFDEFQAAPPALPEQFPLEVHFQSKVANLEYTRTLELLSCCTGWMAGLSYKLVARAEFQNVCASTRRALLYPCLDLAAVCRSAGLVWLLV